MARCLVFLLVCCLHVASTSDDFCAGQRCTVGVHVASPTAHNDTVTTEYAPWRKSFFLSAEVALTVDATRDDQVPTLIAMTATLFWVNTSADPCHGGASCYMASTVRASTCAITPIVMDGVYTLAQNKLTLMPKARFFTAAHPRSGCQVRLVVQTCICPKDVRPWENHCHVAVPLPWHVV